MAAAWGLPLLFLALPAALASEGGKAPAAQQRLRSPRLGSSTAAAEPNSLGEAPGGGRALLSLPTLAPLQLADATVPTLEPFQLANGSTAWFVPVVAKDADTECLQMFGLGCSAIQDERTCLSSLDGRRKVEIDGLKIRGQPCVWCGGVPCVLGSLSRCEPHDYLLHGEGVAFSAFNAESFYEVAKCKDGRPDLPHRLPAVNAKAGVGLVQSCGEKTYTVPDIMKTYGSCDKFCSAKASVTYPYGNLHWKCHKAWQADGNTCHPIRSVDCDKEFDDYMEVGLCRCQVAPWDGDFRLVLGQSQCGGQGWTGATQCEEGLDCYVRNESFSQCLPGPPKPPGAGPQEPGAGSDLGAGPVPLAPSADCWKPCGERGGLCESCGESRACCRQGWEEDPAECKAAKNYTTWHHECVDVPTPAPGGPPLAVSPTGTPTGAPGTPTGAPGTPTGAPGTPTGAPGTPTGAPGTPTGAPGTPTGAPGTPTGAPGSSTEAPTAGGPTGAPGLPGSNPEAYRNSTNATNASLVVITEPGAEPGFNWWPVLLPLALVSCCVAFGLLYYFMGSDDKKSRRARSREVEDSHLSEESSDAEDKGPDLFDLIDRDHDGVITAEEFAAAMGGQMGGQAEMVAVPAVTLTAVQPVQVVQPMQLVQTVQTVATPIVTYEVPVATQVQTVVQVPSPQPAQRLVSLQESSLFDVIDRNHDGAISMSEFSQAMGGQAQGPSSPPSPQRLSPGAAAAQRFLLRQQRPSQVSQVARRQEPLTATAAVAMQQDRGSLFDVIDRNHDGAITMSEFSNAMGGQVPAAIRAPPPPPPPQPMPPMTAAAAAAQQGRGSLFDMIDRNHDGGITMSEFSRAMGGQATMEPMSQQSQEMDRYTITPWGAQAQRPSGAPLPPGMLR